MGRAEEGAGGDGTIAEATGASAGVDASTTDALALPEEIKDAGERVPYASEIV